MAPPPRVAPKSERLGARAEAADEAPDLESDLEKDLVISPPPPKTDQKPAMEEKPAAERRSGTEKKAVTGQKAEKKKATPSVKRIAPSEFGNYAASPKPIQKVPSSCGSDPWSYPAGPRTILSHPGQQYLTDEPRRPVNRSSRRFNGYPGTTNPDYAGAVPRRTADRPCTEIGS